MENELKDAIIKFNNFFFKLNKSKEEAYEKLFKEFDTDNNFKLTREEFLAGLDKYNDKINLTTR
jgi:hypothetical protein